VQSNLPTLSARVYVNLLEGKSCIPHLKPVLRNAWRGELCLSRAGHYPGQRWGLSLGANWCFSDHQFLGTPVRSLDGFHGKSPSKMENWGCPGDKTDTMTGMTMGFSEKGVPSGKLFY